MWQYPAKSYKLFTKVVIKVVIKLSAFFPLNIPFYFSSFECFILYFSAVLFCVFRLFHFIFFGSFILYFSAVLFSTSTPLPSTSPAHSPYSLCPRGSRYGSPRGKRSPAPPASPAVWWHRHPDLQNLPGHGRDPALRSRCRFSPPPGSVSWLHSRIWRSHIPTVRGGDHLTIF